MGAVYKDNSHLWIALYFLANLGLTIHNKWVLQKLHFNFPWLLSAIHIGLSGLGAAILMYKFKICDPAPLNRREKIILTLFSFLYTINIAISNVSLKYVSLAFHQIMRSSNPAFTIFLELFLLKKKETFWIYASLVPVTKSESQQVDFDMLGCALTVFGVVLSALKGVVSNILMVGSLKLHPLDLLARMAPMAVLQCLVYGWYFGELAALPEFIKRETESKDIIDILSPIDSVFLKLFYNGCLAFLLNYVSFTANKKTSALTMTVAGNVKQAFSILLAVYIFNTVVSPVNALGILITLAGGAWYSSLSYKKSSQAKKYNLLPTSSDDLDQSSVPPKTESKRP